MLANITVRSVENKKPGTIKIKTTDNKSWNCNKEELIGNFVAGERYHIEYAESKFDGQNGPIVMKWVNRARFWKEDDGANTWPDKEEYKGGGQSNATGGSKVSQGDYDPEVGKRQTAANCTAQYLSRQEGLSVDEFVLVFPVVADVVLKWVNDKGVLAPVVDTASAPSAGGDDDGEDFGF